MSLGEKIDIQEEIGDLITKQEDIFEESFNE